MDFDEKQKNKKIKNVAPKKAKVIIYQRFSEAKKHARPMTDFA